MSKINILLLVDDDPDDQDLFEEAVREIDPSIQCLRAYHGEQALELLQLPNAPLPDLIFMDLNMPRMNGRVCLARLKAHTRLCDIPVVIYSHSRRPEEREELLALGAAHFISKPMYYNEMQQVLALALQMDFSAAHVSSVS